MSLSSTLVNNNWIQAKIRDVRLSDIRTHCSVFLQESQNLPLYKQLQDNLSEISKIKVRHKKHESDLSNVYGSAFIPNIREKAVFSSGSNTDATHYIFPKNGYKYLYSKEVQQSNSDYKTVLTSLVENLDSDKAYNIITDMLKFTYSNTNLREGLAHGSEIIVYNVPFYYAVSINSFPEYSHLLYAINEAL